jgi:formamidopyrimidine-DNA glycosylase
MPELPEVETVRRGLEPALVGRRIVRVEQRRADLRFPFPDRFVERLEGTSVAAFLGAPSICWPSSRRAKRWSCISA